MNVLNRIGWIIWPLTVFFVIEVLGENLIEGYRVTYYNRMGFDFFEFAFYSVFPLAFIDYIFSELRERYLYSFYPISFFDRNWYVILLFFYSLYMFRREIYIVFSVSLMLLILNEFFRRWRERKKRIETDKIKKILEHPDYDAAKLKLKYYQKDFFVRNWFLLIIPAPLIFIPNPTLRGVFLDIIILFFIIFEIINKLKAIKDVREIIGEKEILSSDDSV